MSTKVARKKKYSKAAASIFVANDVHADSLSIFPNAVSVEPKQADLAALLELHSKAADATGRALPIVEKVKAARAAYTAASEEVHQARARLRQAVELADGNAEREAARELDRLTKEYDRLRNEAREPERAYARIKTRELPAFTAATFREGNNRSGDAVNGYGYVTLDFDELPNGNNPAAAFDALSLVGFPQLPSIAAAYPTPKGFRVLVKVTPVRSDEHPAGVRFLYLQAEKAATQYVSELFSILGTPEERSAPEKPQTVWSIGGRFYLNPTAETLNVQYTDPPPPPSRKTWKGFDFGSREGSEFSNIADLQLACEWAARKGSFAYTANCKNWIRFIAAMANVFGEAGLSVCVDLCALNAGYRNEYSRKETETAYRRFLTKETTTTRPAGIGTIKAAFEVEGIPVNVRTTTRRTADPVVQVNRYAAEQAATLAALIESASGPVNLQAPTGTGKTRFVCDYLKAKADADTNCIHVLIQFQKFNAQDIGKREGIPAIYEGVGKKEIADFLTNGHRVFVTTPDSLFKLLDFDVYPETIVLDELHDLANNAAFRPLVRQLFEWMETKECDRLITMTATPPAPLLMAIAADSSLGLIQNVRIEPTDRPTDYALTWACGNRADLLTVVAHYVKQGNSVALHIDRKIDTKNRKSVFQLAESLRAVGIATATATAEEPDGIQQFRDGQASVLIGTRLINAGYDIAADGKDVIVIQATTTNGINPEDAAQLAGRFRNAASVTALVWTFGTKGEVLLDASQRSNTPKDAAPFDLTKAYNRARDKVKTRFGVRRTGARRRELAAPGREAFIREKEGRTAADPLKLTYELTNDRNKQGGLPAFISAFRQYVHLAAPPEALDIHDILRETHITGIDDMTPLDLYLEQAARRFDDLTDEQLIAVALTSLAEGEGTQHARALAERWKIALAGDATALLLEFMNEGQDETFKELTAGTFGFRFAFGVENVIKSVASLLLALPPEAKRRDALNIVATLPDRTAAAVQQHRTQFLANLNIQGGVTDDVPAQAFHDLSQTFQLERLAAVRNVVPLLMERGPQTVKGWHALIRELTGLDFKNQTEAMALLRAVCNVEARTGMFEGTRTTVFEIVSLTEWRHFRQSYTPREAVEAAIYRYSRAAHPTGPQAPPPFSFSLSKKMQPYENCPFKRLNRSVPAPPLPFPPN